MAHALFAPDCLTAAGWQRDVLLTWDAEGTLTAVAPDQAPPAGTPIAHGPVIPGMANLHSHAFQRAMAGLAEHRASSNDTFWTWRETMYHLVERLTPEAIGAIATHLYIELLKHGYTGVAEFHYLHNQPDGTAYAEDAELALRIAHAARSSGIACTLLPVLYAWGGFGARPLQGGQRRFGASVTRLARIAECARGAGVRIGLAPHSVRAVDAMLLQEAVAALDELAPRAPIHIHASEQLKEVEECLATHGTTPIDWITEIAPVDDRWCFIHATHITPGEAHKLIARGALAGLCPSTEANLGDGIFPFAAWWHDGGRFGIGGDSHVSVSAFEELRLLETVQRLTHRRRNVTTQEALPSTASNLWTAAAAGGGQALGGARGAIGVGAPADLVVLDGQDVDLQGLGGMAALAVAMFSSATNRVRDVAVAGRWLIEARHHAGEADAARSYREALAALRG
jgi:formimidoylglutamate deiminase